MAVHIMGDVHGAYQKLLEMFKHVSPNDTIICVGDFGIYHKYLKHLKKLFKKGYPCKVLVIDGNHEDFRIINGWSKDELTEFHTNFFYVPRGYVTVIEGKLFAFLGGAESIDFKLRTLGKDFFAEERIQQEDVDKLIKNVNGRKVDYLITHTPPEFINRVYFPITPDKVEYYNLPLGWIDESAVRMNKVHWALRPKKHFCGHMHGAILHDTVRILNIDEVVTLYDADIAPIAQPDRVSVS